MAAEIFHKILIADDGSPDGERAADVAVRMAARLKAEVILLGVVEPPNIQAEGEGLPVEDPTACRHRMEERFERFLRLGHALDVEMTVEIAEGRPCEQIRKRAEAEKVDLVILGRRNLSTVRRWLEGSTSEYVLKHLQCSVMIAR